MRKKNKAMIKKEQEQRRVVHFNAKALGEGLVNSWWDSEDMGPNFSWDNVPETARRLARVNCFTWFPNNTKITKTLENFAAGVAYNAARSCIDSHREALEPSNE